MGKRQSRIPDIKNLWGAKWDDGKRNGYFAAFVPLLISRNKSLKDSRQFSTVSFTQKSSAVMIFAGLILRISKTAGSFRPSMGRPNTTILRQGGGLDKGKSV